MVDSNYFLTPLEVRPKFNHHEDEKLVNPIEYQSLIGYYYLTHTRPNILFTMGFLS